MKNLSPVEKMEIVQIFLNDMTEALNYLHRSRLLIHCDIKPDNIVVSKVPTGSYKFKLIDFGSLTNIDKMTGIAVPGSNPPRTEPFFKETFHENTLSFAYDEYCVLFSALMMLGIGYNFRFVNQIAEVAYTMMIKRDKNSQIVNEIINRINKNNPRTIARLLKFEDSTLTSRAKEGYKSLLSFLLTTPCKSGILFGFK
jgi:serine/threonine protein kinase